MPPPKLTADAPVLDVLHPMPVAVLEFGRMKLNGVVHHCIQRRFGQLLHGHEPLKRQPWLNDRIGALTASHLVGVVLHLHQVAEGIQLFGERLAAFEAVHALVVTCFFGHGAVGLDGVDGRQTVLLAQLVVVHVMGWGHLEAPCAKLHVDVIVRDDGDFSVHDWHQDLLAHQVLVTLIVRMHTNGGVSHDGLWTCGGDCDPTVRFANNGITHIVQLAMLFRVDDLLIAQRCQCHGIPIDHAHPPVNQTAFMHLNEGVDDPLVVPLVHGEAGSVPIATGTELLELFQDDPTMLMGPFPCMFEEGLSGEV